MRLKFLAAMVAVSGTFSGVAEEQKTWEASSELGAIITSGNTDNNV